MISFASLPYLIKQVAKTPAGKDLLREQRHELLDLIRQHEAAGSDVPKAARKLLERINKAIGDSQVQA